MTSLLYSSLLKPNGFKTLCLIQKYVQQFLIILLLYRLYSVFIVLEPYKLPVAHRDICSGNILLRENLRLVVADFGVAAILDEFSAENTENITKVRQYKKLKLVYV